MVTAGLEGGDFYKILLGESRVSSQLVVRPNADNRVASCSPEVRVLALVLKDCGGGTGTTLQVNCAQRAMLEVHINRWREGARDVEQPHVEHPAAADVARARLTS